MALPCSDRVRLFRLRFRRVRQTLADEQVHHPVRLELRGRFLAVRSRGTSLVPAQEQFALPDLHDADVLHLRVAAVAPAERGQLDLVTDLPGLRRPRFESAVRLPFDRVAFAVGADDPALVLREDQFGGLALSDLAFVTPSRPRWSMASSLYSITFQVPTIAGELLKRGEAMRNYQPSLDPVRVAGTVAKAKK